MDHIRMKQIDASGIALTACTRKGEGPWKGVTPEALAAYAALGKELGSDPAHMVRVRQEHTARVLKAVLPDVSGQPAGQAAAPVFPGDGVVREAPAEGADGLITNVPGLVLCVVTADCVPVFLLDPVRKAAGLVHSGWKGTAACISVNAVRLMQKEYGSRPEDLLVSIGPHNCGKCYEVGEELMAEFGRNYSEAELTRFFRRKQNKNTACPKEKFRMQEKYLLDLSLAIRLSLLRTGVREERIEDCGICTFEDPHFWSWRRDRNPEGRILSAIVLRGEAQVLK